MRSRRRTTRRGRGGDGEDGGNGDGDDGRADEYVKKRLWRSGMTRRMMARSVNSDIYQFTSRALMNHDIPFSRNPFNN